MLHFGIVMLKRVVITGGHFTPGFAVIEEFKSSRSWEVFWIGDREAVNSGGVASIEARVLPEIGVPFWHISASRLQRKFPIRSMLGFWRLPVAFFQAFAILLKVEADVVLSLGSYVSLPVVFAAWVLRIPVVVHEQTSRAGLANRIGAFFSKFVAVSSSQSRRFFLSRKVYVTGNPVREEIWKAAEKRAGRRGRDPIIYVTGGSRGAQRINKVIFESLPGLLKLAKVYHQTGQLDFNFAVKIKEKLEGGLQTRYSPYAYLSFDKVCKIYERADLVISRAGANTVSELAILGIPSILIPIQWSQKNEQLENAKGLQRLGNGIVLEEKDLSFGNLLNKVEDVLKSSEKYKKVTSSTFLAREDAAKKIVELVEKAIVSERK